MYCVLRQFDNWYIIACGDPINGELISRKIFMMMIITSSVCFAEIIRHCIVLRMLSTLVLRLLCLL